MRTRICLNGLRIYIFCKARRVELRQVIILTYSNIVCVFFYRFFVRRVCLLNDAMSAPLVSSHILLFECSFRETRTVQSNTMSAPCICILQMYRYYIHEFVTGIWLFKCSLCEARIVGRNTMSAPCIMSRRPLQTGNKSTFIFIHVVFVRPADHCPL